MSIRRSAMAPNITQDDLQFTINGRSFAVELTDFEDNNFAMLLERVGLAWVVAHERALPLEGFTDNDITAAGGPVAWIRNVFVPALNRWLGVLFGATPPASGARPTDVVDTMLGRNIRVVAQGNGTYLAEYVG